MLNALREGSDICVTVTLLDGLILARSIFHHSMNYRSVVVFGRAAEVEDPEEKLRALERFSERVVPGRWRDVRPPNEQEMAATLVVKLPLDECSAKIRTGPPIDDEADLQWPVWAGVLPLEQRAGAPVPAPDLAAGIEPPGYVTDYRRGKDRI
jgi:nitroimidazol reductase NimA-like FMN-containing flavoprotein (pyridoxamine 5'-phosphate oxidase superfamily)